MKEKLDIAQNIIKAGLEEEKMNGINESILVELIQISGYLTLLTKKGDDGQSISDEEFTSAQKINERLNEILNYLK